MRRGRRTVPPVQGWDPFSRHPYSGLMPRALRCHRFAVAKTALLGNSWSINGRNKKSSHVIAANIGSRPTLHRARVRPKTFLAPAQVFAQCVVDGCFVRKRC